MFAAYPNTPLLSIPVAAAIAYAPHFIRVLVVLKATKRWNNVSPRGQVDKLENRMTKATWALAKRCEGAHHNGLESLGLYSAAILAALHAGVAKETVSSYTTLYIISRLLYNGIYLFNTNEVTAASRTVVWSASVYACIKLLLAAAATKY
ncbi:hypothetical protein BGZ76_004357 [Entomortierella beljakovae]|nr:hypothetical protein BGZ76_004357 [Entomortierella beljakovae]